MTPDISSRFLKWNMTEQEEIAALNVPIELRARIQNLRAEAATELVNNVVTPIAGTEYDKLIQARLLGEIKAYDLLLAEVIQPQSQEGN